MVGHGGSSAGSHLAIPTSPIPSHCASIVATSTVRVKTILLDVESVHKKREHRESAVHLVRFCRQLWYLWATAKLTLTVLVTTIDAQWELMGDVGSVRYKPALLPPCPTIRVLSYSN